jgi:anti-anti-sigma factor
MDLDLSTRQVADRAVVSVGGEVDLETASQLGDHALDALRDGSPHLVLDLAGVTFMDSTGLQVLLTIMRRAELAGGSMAVAGASRTVRKLLSLTGLDQTFTLYDSVDDATGVAAPATGSASGSAAGPTA